MPRSIKILLLIVFGIAAVSLANNYLVFAAESDNITETVFFGNVKDNDGCGVFMIVNTVVDVLSIGVGILAVIGITIAGINYLTAGGNEQKTRKAKHRILQIVIGVVIYVIMYAALQWLLPGGKLDFTQRCATVSDQELAKIKEEEKAAREAERGKESSSGTNTETGSTSGTNNNYKKSKNYEYCMKHAAAVVKKAGICGVESAAQRIVKTAELLAWPKGTSSKKYKYPKGNPTKAFKSARAEVLKGKGNWNAQTRKGASCLVFSSTVARGSGIDSKFPPGNNQYTYSSSKFDKITCKKCNPYSKSKAGDIVLYYDKKWGGSGHALVRGNGVIYEAQFHGKTYGHVSSANKLNKKKAYVVIFRPKD